MGRKAQDKFGQIKMNHFQTSVGAKEALRVKIEHLTRRLHEFTGRSPIEISSFGETVKATCYGLSLGR